jgi:hypothetical protein
MRARGPSRCPPIFVCLPGAARWPLCSPPACRQLRGFLAFCRGGGVFSSRLARARATKHEAAHTETEAVSEDGRCCMRARCVITEHLADRRKSPVWSTETTYLLGMAGCRITPVLVFWTLRVLYWVEFTFETSFELPSSWSALPCYGANRNRNILDFMRWPQIDLGAQDINDIQRPKSFHKNSWK